MFNKAATNGRLDYNKFVDDMKITAKDRDQKTSLDIEDPANEYAARKEETSRNKLYGLGFALNQKSSNVNMSNGNNGSGSNHTSRRIAWNDMSKKEKHSNLVRDRVMRRLQEENDKVEAAFVSVDKQRDGCLNKTEFQQGLKRVGITLSTEDATSFFNGLPRGADGLLNYHTFANYLQKKNVNSYSLNYYFWNIQLIFILDTSNFNNVFSNTNRKTIDNRTRWVGTTLQQSTCHAFRRRINRPIC